MALWVYFLNRRGIVPGIIPLFVLGFKGELLNALLFNTHVDSFSIFNILQNYLHVYLGPPYNYVYYTNIIYVPFYFGNERG